MLAESLVLQPANVSQVIHALAVTSFIWMIAEVSQVFGMPGITHLHDNNASTDHSSTLEKLSHFNTVLSHSEKISYYLSNDDESYILDFLEKLNMAVENPDVL